MAGLTYPPSVSGYSFPSGGGGGGAVEDIQIQYAHGDRNVEQTLTLVNILVGAGLPSQMLTEQLNTFYWNFRALDGTEYLQVAFTETVRLEGIVYEQSDGSDQGIWSIETLSGGIYTAQAANVQMGLGTASSLVWANTWLIDAANQADCDGYRIRGVSGSITNGPWRNNLRAYVTK